jgi:DNA-binding NarL/FixJ family response regulator
VRLLIADDNATSRRLLRALLETREGWQVCGEATNGVEAVAKAAELKPEIIILDLAMPIMDGMHAAQEISAAFPTIPILLYTMHSFAGLDLEAKKVGIRKVVSKTDTGNNLLNAIDELLGAIARQTPLALAQAAAQGNSPVANGSNEPGSPPETDPNSKLN